MAILFPTKSIVFVERKQCFYHVNSMLLQHKLNAFARRLQSA